MDTTVWSLALRRLRRNLNRKESSQVDEWRALVRDGRAHLIGPIRQEVLSGIRFERQFRQLRERLSDFDDIPLLTADYERAARYFNTCRKHGVTGGGVDFLICSVAKRLRLPVFTTDPDFAVYAQHIPLKLHE